ncbi:MAG: antitoxin Xre/MbcA/ParS toxin-binding domain-containing protein [Bacteroidota bacterium]
MKAEEPFATYGILPRLSEISDLELARKAQEGISTKALWDFLKSINYSKMEFEEYLPLSLKSLSRKETLDENESERILSIMRVFERGRDFFGAVEPFKKWLKAPNPYLGDAPASLLKTSTGCQAILHEIGRAEHGIMT